MEFFNYVTDKCDFIINFLLKQTIYTSILFVIIFAISFLFKKKSPHWHFGLWMLILIRLLLPTDLSLSISARSALDRIPIVNQVATSIDSISSKTGYSKNKNILIALVAFQNSAAESKDLSFSAITSKNKLFSWPLIVAFLWITGCMLMIVLVLKKQQKYRGIIRESVLSESKKLLAFLTEWQYRLKIRRTIRIVTSDEFLSPFTTGIFKPKIYIPKMIIDSADTDTLHSIIAHELVHIKHFDVLWIILQNILQIIYFFNPVVWYASRQIDLSREQICDSAVLTSRIIPPGIYGKSVLQILKYNLFGFDLAELLPCFGSHKKIYKQRIQNITKESAMKKQKTMFIVMAICLIGFFVLPLAGNTDAVQNEKSASNSDKDKIGYSIFSNRESFLNALRKNASNDDKDKIMFSLPLNTCSLDRLFGWSDSPSGSGREFHTGIDLKAPQGTPIHASASGVVTKAGWGQGYGNMIILMHGNGYSTAYGHCEKILVNEGQAVKSGDTIATCGQTGSANSIHLHYEIRKDGEAIDPYNYIYPSTPPKIYNSIKAWELFSRPKNDF